MTAVMLHQQKVPVLLLTAGGALSLHHYLSFQSGLDTCLLNMSAHSHVSTHKVLCPHVARSQKCRLRASHQHALLPALGSGVSPPFLARRPHLEGSQVGSARKKSSKAPPLVDLCEVLCPRQGIFWKGHTGEAVRQPRSRTSPSSRGQAYV